MSTGKKSPLARALEDMAILDPRPPAIFQRDLVDQQVERLNLPRILAQAEKVTPPSTPAPRKKGRRS